MKRKRLLWLGILLIIAIIILVILLMPRINEKQKAFLEKANLFKAEVITDETIENLGDSPVSTLGYVVFISVCDGSSRAKVYQGMGKELSDAWDQSVQSALKDISDESMDSRWIRADIVSSSWSMSALDVLNELKDTYSGFDFNGLAIDPQFNSALIEGELNALGIYDYKEDRIDMGRLNDWMKENGKEHLKILPDNMMGFKCWSWFLDEDNTVYPLCREGADTGRRQVSSLNADYVKNIIDSASSFLVNQVQLDGRFIYGIHPRFDKEINGYNMLRHSGTIWSLICRYRMFPEDALKEKIELTIDYMLNQILYDEDGAAYLFDKDDDEIKLGGNGIAIVTLTEYMDLFQNTKYQDICIALGEGIIKQQNPEKGSYWHILYRDFSKLEEFRTIYYDGECTFALTRLYSLTGEQKWLDAACKAIDHFIEKDYTQYRDHWVAYSLNEVTKYVNRKEYWDFALANASNNYKRIMGRARTYPTNLELLISSFETWQRMVDKGIDTGDFDVKELLNVISARANRQLSGYFYPELAMYMANPQRILGSFMMRDDIFRVRIDDVQHNIGGYYLYWKNYDAMVNAGLDSSVIDDSQRWD